MESENSFLEYLIAARLNKDVLTYDWSPETIEQAVYPIGDKLAKPRHHLYLKRAILGPNAVPGELNLVEMITKDLSGTEIRVPLAYLKAGTEYQSVLDLSLADVPVKFNLVMGSGPLYILGQHVISAQNSDENETDEDEDLEAEESGGELEDEDKSMVEDIAAAAEGEANNDKKRKIDSIINGDATASPNETKKFKALNGNKEDAIEDGELDNDEDDL